MNTHASKPAAPGRDQMLTSAKKGGGPQKPPPKRPVKSLSMKPDRAQTTSKTKKVPK